MNLSGYSSEIITDFSAGMNDKFEPNLVKNNQAVDLQNVMVTIIGRIKKRPGCSKLNTTALGGAILGLHGYHYGTGLSTHKLIAAANGVVAYWDTGTSAFVNIKTGLNATAQVLFATCVNYLVYMNGMDAPRKWDGTTDSALSNAPATGKCPVLYKEKLFCIVDEDTINWSDSFAPETWPGVNTKDFDRGDGDELSGLFPYMQDLIVSKKRSLHVFKGSSLDDFRSARVEDKHGVAGPLAGVVVEPYFYYISEDGIFRWDTMKSFCLTDPPLSSGLPGIPTLWATVNKLSLAKSTAGYNKAYNQLWFCVPEGSATTNNMVLVYDLNFNSWWVFRGIPAYGMIQYNNGSTIKTYAGHSSSGYLIEINTGFNDMGAAISSYWTGRNLDGGDPEQDKRVRVVALLDANGLNDATFSYRLDNAGSYTSPTALSDSNDVRHYNITNGRCNSFQPKLSHSTIDKDFSCSGIKVFWKPL